MAEEALLLDWSDDGVVRAESIGGDGVLPAERPVPSGGGTVTVTVGLALRLGRPVAGPSSVADVLDATTAVLGALVADRRLVLGGVGGDPRRLDLALLGVVLDVDGVQVGTSCGAAALGHPAAALVAAATTFPAGALVFSGPLLPPVALGPASHLVATFAHLGPVHLRT